MNIHTILVTIMVTSMILTAFAIPGGESQGEEREFRNVHMNLKVEDKLNPEFEHRNDTEAQSRHVRAEYTQLPRSRYDRQWVDVGDWISDPLDGSMTMRERVTFNIWFQESQSDYDAQPDWEFTLYHNDDQVAQATITNSESSKDHPVEVTASADINEPRNVMTGDTVRVYIRYRAWEDCDVFYDNISFDSGATVNMDSLIILEACSAVSANFYDVWGINWANHGKFFCFVTNAGNVFMSDEETEVSPGGTVEGENGTTYETTKIIWKDIPIAKGTGVTITINYGPNGTSEGWTFSFTAGSADDKKKDDDDDDINVAMAGGVGLVVVLGIIGAILFIKKRKTTGEEYYEDEEYYEEEYEEEEE